MDENGQQASPGLAGTRWELTQLRGAPVRGQTRPTLEFGAEGRASGNTGCNSFFGQYESTGSAIDFGALGSTRRACLDEGANATEQSYLRALDAATRHEINGGVLTLYAGDEAVARFRRAASSPSR